jgi:hypothetical protein
VPFSIAFGEGTVPELKGYEDFRNVSYYLYILDILISLNTGFYIEG